MNVVKVEQVNPLVLKSLIRKHHQVISLASISGILHNRKEEDMPQVEIIHRKDKIQLNGKCILAH